MNCPKCQGKMERGWLVDFAHGGIAVLQWAPGTPERSWWSGAKVNRKKLLEVTTFRCSECGYLEVFANPERETLPRPAHASDPDSETLPRPVEEPKLYVEEE